MLLVIVFSLAPRTLGKAIKSCWYPDDLDIMRYIRKTDPQRTLSYQPEVVHSISSTNLKPVNTRATTASRRSGVHTPRRRDHGFDFSQEENGVAIRRMQTNLSERDVTSARQQKLPLRRKGSVMLASLTKSIRKSRPPIPNRTEGA